MKRWVGVLALGVLLAGCSGSDDRADSFTKVSTGYTHTCALDSSGNAWCWGSNSYGELGTGDLKDVYRPARVKSNVLFTELSAGKSHTCGVDSDGATWCWGSNLVGQSGASKRTALVEPRQVNGIPPAASVAAGNDKTCAVTVDGGVYCWGDNSFDQLGMGGADAVHGEALKIPVNGVSSVEVKHVSTCMAKRSDLICHDVRFTEDTVVAGFTGFKVDGAFGPIKDIESTLSKTCVLYADSKLRCWYRPPYIVTEDGKREFSEWPAPIEEDGRYRDLAGADSTLCAIRVDDVIVCRGLRPPFSTFLEQDKFTLDSPGQKPWTFEGFPGIPDDIDGGVAHFCATNTDGELWCWGWNSRGQLGNGDTVDTTKPVRVKP